MFLDVTRLEKPKLFISSTMDRQTINYRKDMIEQLKNEDMKLLIFSQMIFHMVIQQTKLLLTKL